MTSEFTIPIRLLNTTSTPSIPRSGFQKLYFKNTWLTSLDVNGVERDIVLHRTLSNFILPPVATVVTNSDTIKQAIEKLQKSLNSITLIGSVTGTASYDSTLGVLKITTAGSGSSAFLYVAYASDNSGTDFTMTFDPALEYIGIKVSALPIPSPSAADFVGLWQKYVGADGREVQLQNNGTYIQWRYVGSISWTNLVSLASITGPAGTNGTNGANGTNGTDGADGKEIELQNNGTHIQWRYVGDIAWTNLVSIISITGPAGANGTDGTDGREIELQNTGVYIQWRYVGDISWTNLISIASITGPQGPAGVDAPIFDKRTEWVSLVLMYQGFAPQGSAESDAVWTIYKIVTLATGGVVSNTEFTNKKWTERSLL
jgi:hypothetical protein